MTRLNQFGMFGYMKTVYSDENNVVLDESSAERKPFLNREIKSNQLTI